MYVFRASFFFGGFFIVSGFGARFACLGFFRGGGVFICGSKNLTRGLCADFIVGLIFKKEKFMCPWLLLIAAGGFEIAFAVSIKYSEGFTRIVPTVVMCVCAILSFGLLNVAIKHMPVGTAYAVWTGIGALGTAVYGILVFGESAAAARIICLAFILTGLVGLNLVSEHI